MIITVTPNPTIDRVLFVNNFAMQDVVRAESECVSPSGKAIDVAVNLHNFGVDTVALGLNAGLSGEMLTALLDETGVAYDFVQANGYTRVAALITDTTERRQSTIIAHTLTANAAHLDELVRRAGVYIPRSWGLVCGGSVPPGMPQEAYARLINLAHQHGVTTMLDTSGDSLRLGIAARPDILKVNVGEIAMLAPEASAAWSFSGDPVAIFEKAGALASVLSESMYEWVGQALIITLGSHGSIAITPEGRWYTPALEVPWLSPAGAGDGMTSGIMLALMRDGSWQDAMALGTAMAAAVVMNPGTCECYPYQVEELLPQVQIIAL